MGLMGRMGPRGRMGPLGPITGHGLAGGPFPDPPPPGGPPSGGGAPPFIFPPPFPLPPGPLVPSSGMSSRVLAAFPMIAFGFTTTWSPADSPDLTSAIF